MAPSLVSGTPSFTSDHTNSSTSLVSASFTPANGDVIVVKVATENTDQPTIGTPTGGSQTFTSRVWADAASNTQQQIFTAVVSGSPGAMTVTVPFSGTGGWRSIVVECWTSAQLATTPATASGQGTGAPSQSITTAAANSVVSWVSGDWAAVAPGTPAYRSSATQDGLDDGSPSHYVSYFAYQSAPSAGSQTLGLTAPTGQTWSLAGIEIQAASAGGVDDPNQAQIPRRFPPFRAPIRAPWARVQQLMGDQNTAVTVPVALSDTGAATDALAVSTSVALTDTGAGFDALTLTGTIPLADTAGGADDTLTITGTVPLSDTGTGADGLSVGTPVSLPGETGTGVDSALTVSAAAPLADTGTGTDDALTVTVTAPLSDTGTGADALTVTTADMGTVAAPQWAGMFLQPSAAATQLWGDTQAVPGTVVALTDTGTGIDALAATATAPLADTVAGADSLTISATLTLAGDTGTGTEAISVGVPKALAETAAGTDALSAPSATSPLSDPRTATDTLTVGVTAALSDVLGGTEGLTVLIQGANDGVPVKNPGTLLTIPVPGLTLTLPNTATALTVPAARTEIT